MKQLFLYTSQYGDTFRAHSDRELKSKYALRGRVSPMFVDRDGKTYRVGVVIGPLWLTQWTRVERAQ